MKWPWTKKVNPLEVIAKSKTGREVDFRSPGWGHNIQRCGDRLAAWSSPRLKNGDTIITKLGRFMVHSVEPCYNPPDMVFFMCVKEERLKAFWEQRS